MHLSLLYVKINLLELIRPLRLPNCVLILGYLNCGFNVCHAFDDMAELEKCSAIYPHLSQKAH